MAPEVRVGLNSGAVVVRWIGADLHMDYTVVWLTTHLAGRNEQLAMPGSVLLAPDTPQLAEGYVQVLGPGPTAVKRLAEPRNHPPACRAPPGCSILHQATSGRRR